MNTDLTTRIASNPTYLALKAKRSSFGWMLTVAMLIVYFGFILLELSTSRSWPSAWARA